MDSFDREQYLKELRMYYSGDRDDIEKILEEMSESLDCYLEANPSATTAEIFKHFGHPRELQEQYERSLWLQHHQKGRTGIKTAIVIVCVVCLLFLVNFLIYSYNQFREANGHAEVILEESPVDSTITPDSSAPPKPNFYFSE